MERTVIDGIEVEVLRVYYDDGQLQKEWTQTTHDLHGYSKEFFPSGKLKSHSEYNRGKKCRVDSVWYENGRLRRVIEKDPESGFYFKIEYYEDGILKSKQLVNEGIKNIGDAWSYFPNGKLELQMSYDKTERPIGRSTSFYKSGNRCIEAEYKRGEYYLNNCWQDDGKQVVKGGTGLLTKYDINGSVVCEEEFKDGLRNGSCKSYKNGTLSSCASYVNGKSEGESYRYYPNGKVKEICHMKDGVITHAERDFPMYDNPILVKEISIRPSERRDEENKLIIPVTFPDLINEREVLDSIKIDASVYDNRPQETNIVEVYRVTLREDGFVDNHTRSVGSGYPVSNEIEVSFRHMRFDMKNQIEEGVKNQMWITFKFMLVEGNDRVTP